MKILAIETSGAVESVALLKDNKVICERVLDSEQRTSVTLLPAIAQLFEEQELKIDDLDALAVSIGPGSYTGVRVGIATAQGIAAATSLPVYGISSLDYGQTKKVAAQAVSLGRAALSLSPDQAHLRGEGLQARHNSPGYRIAP